MSVLYSEIIKNSTLNKNTSILVESYLLDPLPFLGELCSLTLSIRSDLDHYTYYNESHRSRLTGLYYMFGCYICKYRTYRGWGVAGRYL